MEKKRQIFHVVMDKSEWKVEKEGLKKVVMKGPIKTELVKKIIEQVSDSYSQVKIHKRDGTIEEERTFQRLSDPIK